MKKTLALTLALVVALTALVPTLASANEFIQSIEGYTNVPVIIPELGTVIDEATGKEVPVVAYIIDAETGEMKEKVGQPKLIITNIEDEPTPENEEALKRIEDATKRVADDGIEVMLTDAVRDKLNAAKVDINDLTVAVIFDACYTGELGKDEKLVFTIQNPALTKMIQTGAVKPVPYVVQEENENFGTADYTIDGDKITFTVSHFCVFMITFERVNTSVHACLHCWLCLILVVIVIILIILLIMEKNKKSREKKGENEAQNQ